MKISALFVILWVLVADAGSAPIQETLYRMFSTSGEPRFTWEIAQEKLSQSPRWSPGDAAIPVTQVEVAKAATGWVARQPWADRYVTIQSIELRQWLRQEEPTGIWYYLVTLVVRENEGFKYPSTVVLLLDGTLIEPTVHQSTKGEDKAK